MRKVWAGVGRDLVLNTAIASPIVPTALRWMLLRAVGMRVDRCGVASRVWFGSRRMTVGRGTFIGYGSMFDTFAPIVIGRDCAIAMQVTFVTSTHRLGGPAKRAGRIEAVSIVVGDGVWIGARATVLPGVTIGDGAVVAAGAVVTHDCEPNTLYAGVPARAVRCLGSGDAAARELAAKERELAAKEAADAGAPRSGWSVAGGPDAGGPDAGSPVAGPPDATATATDAVTDVPRQIAPDDHAVRIARAFRGTH